MNQQTELLKLIVQKMEIKTEENDNDDFSCGTKNIASRNSQWNSVFKNIHLKNLTFKQLKNK